MSYAGKSPTFTSVEATQMVYYGDRDTDGSFRIYKEGLNLVIQIRVAGVWEDRDIIEP